MRRAKGVRCDQIEESLIAKANGFTKKIKKATASGKVVTVDEYFPPDVQAQKFYLQHNRPEVYREVREVKQLVGVEEGFLNFLQRLDDKARQERKEQPPALNPEPTPEVKLLTEIRDLLRGDVARRDVR
jgi:hypothetical protein